MSEVKPARQMSQRLSPPVVATGAVWLLSFAVWMASAVFMEFPHPWTVAGRRLMLCGVGVLLCGVLHLTLQPLRKRPLWLRLAAALPLAVLATAVFITVEDQLYHSAWRRSVSEWYYLYRLNITAIAALWTFLTWCGVYFALQVGVDLADKELRLVEAETMAVDSQNRMLRYQINPHFLFNIHSALATLIHDRKNDQAERLVMGLSGFLRRALEKEPAAGAPLSEELAAVKEYLDLEAIRFGDRLVLVDAIDPALLGAKAPSFILQPLVENAVKHGLGGTSDRVTVELGAAREGDDMLLWVRDDGRGAGAAAEHRLGVGLQNVRRRLQALHGKAAALVTEAVEPHGFKVTLRLPLESC